MHSSESEINVKIHHVMNWVSALMKKKMSVTTADAARHMGMWEPHT
jgi:hypothetical protein